jgi:hypothetical protein
MGQSDYVLAFFANVSPNISKIKLDYGLKVERMKPTNYREFIKDVKKQTHTSIRAVSYPQYGIANREDGYIYFIKGKTENVVKNERDYLINLEQKLRLFKEGYLTFPIVISNAEIINGKLVNATNIFTQIGITLSRDKYTITKDEITELNAFLKKYKVPFDQQYLQLALQNLVSSKTVKPKEIKFLLLMIGFESLFNMGKSQITHTVSRHTALLATRNRTEAHNVYKEMKKYYGIRSKIVHGNSKSKKSVISQSDIVRLRNLLRVCIKKIYLLDMNKDIQFEYLNEQGFNTVKNGSTI